MIVRPRPSAFGLLFIIRGSVIPAIAPELLSIFLLASGVTWLHHRMPGWFADMTPMPFTLLGLALSIFLGFRNNACYERWWEARQQWGHLLAESRNLLRDIVTLVPKDPALCRRLGFRVIGFAHSLRGQLRSEAAVSAQNWLPATERNPVAAGAAKPEAILRAQAADMAMMMRRGDISDILYRLLADRLSAMTDIQTACERLRSTPTPFAYTLLLHRTAWLFCLLLPFGLVSVLGLNTPIVTVILAYAFFGLDALGQELEEPFSLSANAVPLDALVRSIEIATLEALGETEIPLPLVPQGYILL